MYRKKRSKLSVLLANLNAILFFVGFPIFTTIFFGGNGETSSLTIAYRVFTLIIVILIFFTCGPFPKLGSMGRLFIFYWILYLIRIIYDLFLRTDSYYIPLIEKLLHVNTSIVSSFLPMIALLYSYRQINYKKVLTIISVILVLLTLYGLVFQEANTSNNLRVSLNKAQNTLNFGFYSASTVLAGLTLFTVTHNKFLKGIYIFFMIIGFMGVGTAGSRGPFIALSFAIIFPLLINFNLRKFFILLFIFIITLFSQQLILNFISSKFSLLFERMTATIEDNDTSGRDSIFADALAQISKNPILGDWHLLYYQNGKGNFAHNIFLDSWMSLGIFFGSIIIILYIYFIRKAIKLILAKNLYSFVGYIVLLCIGYSISSGGTLPYKDTFNFAFGMLLLTMIPGFILNPFKKKPTTNV